MKLDTGMYITGYSLLRNGKISSGHGLLVEGRGDDLDGLLSQAFQTLQVNYPKFHKMDRMSQCGFVACEWLLSDKKLLSRFSPEGVSMVLGNAHASLDTDTRYRDSMEDIPSPSLFVYTLPNIVIGELCIRHGFKGENAFFVLEKFDPALFCNYVAMVLDNDGAQACIAGWVEVWQNQYDVFLYLTEKSGAAGEGIPCTPENLLKLYRDEYGKVDG